MDSYVLTSFYREPSLSLLAPSRLSPTDAMMSQVKLFAPFVGMEGIMDKVVSWSYQKQGQILVHPSLLELELEEI